MFSNPLDIIVLSYMTVRKWCQVYRYEYEQTAEYMQMQGCNKNQN